MSPLFKLQNHCSTRAVQLLVKVFYLVSHLHLWALWCSTFHTIHQRRGGHPVRRATWLLAVQSMYCCSVKPDDCVANSQYSPCVLPASLCAVRSACVPAADRDSETAEQQQHTANRHKRASVCVTSLRGCGTVAEICCSTSGTALGHWCSLWNSGTAFYCSYTGSLRHKTTLDPRFHPKSLSLATSIPELLVLLDTQRVKLPPAQRTLAKAAHNAHCIVCMDRAKQSDAAPTRPEPPIWCFVGETYWRLEPYPSASKTSPTVKPPG
jgi:hypothetical protein